MWIFWWTPCVGGYPRNMWEPQWGLPKQISGLFISDVLKYNPKLMGSCKRNDFRCTCWKGRWRGTIANKKGILWEESTRGKAGIPSTAHFHGVLITWVVICSLSRNVWWEISLEFYDVCHLKPPLSPHVKSKWNLHDFLMQCFEGYGQVLYIDSSWI